MDKQIDDAASDARAIMACLGPLAIMAADASEPTRAFALLLNADDPKMKETGRRLIENASRALKIARERLDILMQDFGEYFNNCDGCSETMIELTKPMYDVLAKRKAGVSLND